MDTESCLPASQPAGVSTICPASKKRLGWRCGRWILLAVVVSAIVYGSLIPFDIDPAAFRFANGGILSRLHWSYGGISDLIINILAYMPLGWLVLRGLAHRQNGIARPIISAVALGVGLSLAMEILQTGSVQRIASWSDVVLNMGGTALGALLAVVVPLVWSRLRRRMIDRALRNPFAAAASSLAIALLFYHLVPLDFVTTTESLRQSFLNANWDILPTHLVNTNLLQAGNGSIRNVVVGKMMAATWFGMLAFLLAFASLRHSRPSSAGRNCITGYVHPPGFVDRSTSAEDWHSPTPFDALMSAIGHATALALLVECMQSLTVSQAFELSDIVLRFQSVVLGAWTAVFVAHRYATHNDEFRIQKR